MYPVSVALKKRKSVPDQSFALPPHQKTNQWGAKLVSDQCISHDGHIVMIREKAILIKLNQIKISDYELFDKAISDFKPSKCSCPKCGAVGRLSPFDSYQRSMISVHDGHCHDSVVSIPRYICNSCGHTHAVLPDILIPFGSYSLRFVITVLSGYLKRSCTVAEYCEHWRIAISTLYRWIHLFVHHYNSWCRILDRILWLETHAISDVSCINQFPYGFFQRFKFSFLQGHKMSPSVCIPLPDRRHKSHPT